MGRQVCLRRLNAALPGAAGYASAMDGKPMPASMPLWWLPLALALVPVLAVHLAWWLSLRAEHIPDCIPYLEGCTSISRAARHGLGNHLFRYFMLPCAAGQALFWFAVTGWLRAQGRRVGLALPALGLLAAIFLGLYATFLGTEGDVYRLLRRYGVTVYFASTYLALLLALRATARPAIAPHRALLVVALGMLVLGVLSTIATATVSDEALKDRIENVLEWHLGAWLTAMFLVFAWRWRRDGTRVALLPAPSKPL